MQFTSVINSTGHYIAVDNSTVQLGILQYSAVAVQCSAVQAVHCEREAKAGMMNSHRPES